MVLVDGSTWLESVGHATGPRNDGEVRTFIKDVTTQRSEAGSWGCLLVVGTA
jgi:hypothetical protein